MRMYVCVGEGVGGRNWRQYQTSTANGGGVGGGGEGWRDSNRTVEASKCG